MSPAAAAAAPPFAIEGLPLFLGVSERPAPAGPRLPFALGVLDHGLVAQTTFAAHAAVLGAAYASGALLSTPPGGEGYGARRFEELRDGLRATGALREGARVLETGCGDGRALAALAREHGVRATGCDPGPAAAAGATRGVEIVRAPFADGLFPEGRFDLVFSSMVLEHVADPEAFLRAQAALLATGGTLFAAVPACGDQLETGDLNLPCHQHATYFTERTLKAMLRRAGLADVEVRPAAHTLSLHAWGRCPSGNGRDSSVHDRPPAPDLARYALRFRERLGALRSRLDRLRGRRLALCGASTGAALVTGLLDLGGIDVRILDSDPAKRGRFLPGVAAPIAGDAVLDREPADEVWVLPARHGEAIAAALRRRAALPADAPILRC